MKIHVGEKSGTGRTVFAVERDKWKEMLIVIEALPDRQQVGMCKFRQQINAGADVKKGPR